jgi:very-short-patch-repair endonuclease
MLFTAVLLSLLVRAPRALFPVLSRSGPHCEATSMLNRSEQRLYTTLTAFCRDHAPHLGVAPQVAYGAFLRTTDRSRWREIAYKRADFVLFSRDGRVHAVVEFDGAGHLGDSFADARRAIRSDQAKNGACASAGIPVIRVMQRYTKDDVALALETALRSSPTLPDSATTGRTRRQAQVS